LADAGVSGLVVVDKPQGWTSHQVVARCRRLYGTRKVGHAGTLDPMATGVLLVGVNRATRLLGHLAGHDKSYTATIRLGIDTLTDDAEGEITAANGASGVTAGAIGAGVERFTGDISQVPSAVSAIKVDGQRSYARVRAGEQVALAARPVTVTRFDVIAVRAGTEILSETASAVVDVVDVDVVVDCSTGTYIRALARDLGAALGTGGHLTALRRTRVGGFDLSQVMIDATMLEHHGSESAVPPALIPLAEVVRRAFPVLELEAEQAHDVHFGRALSVNLEAGLTAVMFKGEFLALYRPDGAGRAVADAVFVS